MLRPLVRSVLSAVVATCFALSAGSWGNPRDCTSHTTGHDHPEAQQHPHDHEPAPAEQACGIHLCCAHVAPQSFASLAAERSEELVAGAGLTASSAAAPVRPAHSLPFAHAPPA